jgi:hypothetical protein
VLVVASAGEAAASVRRAGIGASGTGRAIAGIILPPLALLGFTAIVFFDELSGGAIAYGRDTTAFYYPLTEWWASQLQQGRLPLWLPLIFGGYPLLADGEIGPLYPPNLLLLATLPTPIAYVWLRALHYAVAAIGLFAFARVLGVGAFGALLGGLSFGFGSFMVGHLQHDNIVRSAAWLPWLLLTAERALRTGGFSRLAWTCGGGVVLALQSLGVHVQPVLLSLLLLAAYLLVGPLRAGATSQATPLTELTARGQHRQNGQDTGATRSSTRRRLHAPRSWLVIRAQIGLGILAVGFGLASAQLVPLYVLGQGSMRPSLVSYAYATSYAVTPAQLLTLVFPYMFNFDAERSWALWSTYESTLYAGVPPLVLALVAMTFQRSRVVLFFAGTALVSLVLCLGDYLPVKPYSVIWNLPGFGFLRAPARFSLLLELALAVLAAVAADWLGRRAVAQIRDARSDRSIDTAATPRRSRLVGILGSFLIGVALTSLGLGLLFQIGRWLLLREPTPLLDLIQALYLDMSRENVALGPWHVYYGLLEFSRPDNPRTALGVLLLAATPLLLRAWLTRPQLDAVWRVALGLLVAGDLWLFVGGFHRRARLDDVRPRSPVLSYIASQPGPFRVFVEPALNQTLGPNQLVPNGLATINGYSSLEPPRLSEYWWSVVVQDNFLLDIFNVRYVIAARQVPGQLTYHGTRYHPNDRLVSGEANNRAGREQFHFAPIRAESLTVVAAVDDFEGPAGDPVAELTLIGAQGEQHTLTLRAGHEIGEYRPGQPGRPAAGYTGPAVVWAGVSFAPNAPSEPVRLYGATVPVDPPVDIVGVAVQVLTPSGRLHLHGLGIRAAEGVVYSVKPSDRAKYRPLYEDSSLTLLDNTLVWPRVYVVGGGVDAASDVPIVEQLLERSWDPAREVLLEGVRPSEVRRAEGNEPIGQAELLAYEPDQVVVGAELAAPGYLVLADRYADGWHARAGGVDLPIFRANGIQRAVPLPAGSHVVTFDYDPWWVRLGFALSGATALAMVGVLAVIGQRAFRRSSIG